MKGKILSKRIRYGVYVVSVLLVVVATYFLLPTDDDFSHYFEEGKPWTYDELMAPKDFAVFKSDEQLEMERAEALKELEPYLVSSQVSVLNSQLFTDNQDVNFSDRYKSWVADRLREVYEIGVISLQDRQEMDRLGVSRAVVLEGHNVAEKVDRKSVV